MPAVRGITQVIPVRWRGAVLVAATLVFFPFIVAVMIMDAVMHDFPQLRTLFARRAENFAGGPFSPSCRAAWRREREYPPRFAEG